MPHQILVKERIFSVCLGLRFETDNFKQSRYVGILYKHYFGGFICAMINLTNNKQNKWLSSGSAGTCHSVHTW